MALGGGLISNCAFCDTNWFFYFFGNKGERIFVQLLKASCMKSHWVLSNINLYQILCPHKLDGYSKKNGNTYGKQDVIYAEHQNDQNIYLVTKGKVKIVNYDKAGNELVRHILVKGELFGEKIVLNENSRDEFAVACSNGTEVCAMNLSTLHQLMRRNHRFETKIYKLISLKLRKVERRLELLVGKDVETRIITFIYDLYREDHNSRIANSLSHQDIAKLLATSRETVTKTFNKLKQEGVIDYNRKEITITNVEKLAILSQE